MNQLPLFEDTLPPTSDKSQKANREIGTFKDNMKSPIHGWFRYPAGYSFKFVEAMFNRFSIERSHQIYDPFSGTGTTLVCAKKRGIDAYGVEAHSFVHWVADVKLFWEYDFNALGLELEDLLKQARNYVASVADDADISNAFPELVYKCYHPQDLKELFALRQFIKNCVLDFHVQNLLKLALTDTLRGAAAAGTGWPYIAPKKNNGQNQPKNARAIFESTVRTMFSDLYSLPRDLPECVIKNVAGDSRLKQNLDEGQIDLALTSPPYLNNYDYADRTRLETYFWGIAESWSDITRQFRDKLMVAATTQIVRKQYEVETALKQDIRDLDKSIYQTIQTAVLELARLRPTKGGKKDYDLMVALYFNDIYSVMREVYRVLKPGAHFCLVLGDSAPYGVHIQTDELIGKLGLAIGFSQFDYEEYRGRGGKWKDNPQRHNVQLREGVVILKK